MPDIVPIDDTELAQWAADFEAAIVAAVVDVVGEVADELTGSRVLRAALVAAGPDDAERVRPRWRERVRARADALLGWVFKLFGRTATRVREQAVEQILAQVEPPPGAPPDWRDQITAGPLVTPRDAEPTIEATAQALDALGQDVTTWVRDQITEGLAAGESVDELAARLRSGAHDIGRVAAARIARTETTRAVNAAALAEARALGLSGTKTWASHHDERVRPAHLAADEETVELDEPFIVGGFPMQYPGDPAAPPALRINCFPGDVAVQSVGRIRRVYRRWYEGVMVRVDTASGVQLTGTPNHPVLTMCCGWQPMQRIHVGCQLVKAEVVNRVGLGGPEVDDVPSTLAEIYRAASEAGMLQRTVGSHVDFHGDGSESEVEVVTLNRHLLSPLGESLRDDRFLRAHHEQRAFSGAGQNDGSLEEGAECPGADSGVLSARCVGGGGELAPLRIAGSLHTKGQRGSTAPDLNAGFYEHAADGSPACPEALGNDLLRNPLAVEPDDLRLIELLASGARGSDAGHREPRLDQSLLDGRGARAHALADLVERKTLTAERDDVVKVQLLPYSGHVYNLETDTGMYIGNSIATSNCRCVMHLTIRPSGIPGWAQNLTPGADSGATQEPTEWPEFTGWDNYEGGVVAAMTTETDPATDELQSGMPPQLKAYWLTGPGAAKVRWGTPGSFDRCVSALRKEGVPSPEGTCANLYHEATGTWPGEHRDEDAADVLTAAAEVHTGAMIALVPSEADVERLVVDGGEPADQLHLTVLYLGEAAAIPEEARANLVAELQAWADGDGEQIEAHGFAVNVFNPGSDEPCIVLGVGGDDLAEAGGRIRAVAENVLAMDGVEIPDNHTPWIPHTTLLYLPDATPEEIGARVAELTDRVGPITYDRIRVAYAGDVVDIPLAADTDDEGDEPDGEDEVTASILVDLAAPPSAPGAWEGVLTVEGKPTGDGREFAAMSLTTAPLPLPLMWQRASADGHDGSVVVGRIDEVWRDGAEVWGRGVFDLESADARDAARHVAEGFSRGISVDVDDISEADIELVWAEMLDEDGVPIAFLDRRVFTRGRLRGATLVSIPAFAEAGIQLGWTRTPTTDRLEGMAMTDLAALAACGCEDGAPPREWFADPGLSGPTPLTVTDDGRVFGHGALWGTCHVGIQGQCVTPPREGEHAYYRLGEVLCSDGSTVATGHITVGTGHASTIGITAQAAAEHYDNTGSVVADVASGEDAYGIWVAGALRPGADPARVRELRAAQLSGDWRRLGGKLRLVAMLAVNVPGFPVPRLATASSEGRQTAMVASGIVPERAVLDTRVDELARRIGRDDETKVAALAARMGR